VFIDWMAVSGINLYVLLLLLLLLQLLLLLLCAPARACGCCCCKLLLKAAHARVCGLALQFPRYDGAGGDPVSPIT